jgi:hypothetical protein
LAQPRARGSVGSRAARVEREWQCQSSGLLTSSRRRCN